MNELEQFDILAPQDIQGSTLRGEDRGSREHRTNLTAGIEFRGNTAMVERCRSPPLPPEPHKIMGWFHESPLSLDPLNE